MGTIIRFPGPAAAAATSDGGDSERRTTLGRWLTRQLIAAKATATSIANAPASVFLCG